MITILHNYILLCYQRVPLYIIALQLPARHIILALVHCNRRSFLSKVTTSRWISKSVNFCCQHEMQVQVTCGFHSVAHRKTNKQTNSTTQHNTTQHSPTQHNTALHCTALHCTAQHSTALHYTTLHYTTLHYTTLHYTTLHYTTLHYTTQHNRTLQNKTE